MPICIIEGKIKIRTSESETESFSSFHTLTIAAPVIINGARGNVAIVVKKTKGNRYKTHRILMPDGSRFAFAEKGTAEATTGRMTANNSGESLPITSAVDNSISPKDGVVNTKSALSSKSTKTDQTITQNFKKWFGDWQNSPETASKIVNADGAPMVVYHGTAEEFNIFDLSKSGSNIYAFYYTTLFRKLQSFPKISLISLPLLHFFAQNYIDKSASLW